MFSELVLCVRRCLFGSCRRSKRRRAPSGADNVESVTAGQDDSNDENRAVYHCNYCNKDITGMIHIKCATCTDFDVCIECIFVGAEVHRHKRDHPYRVMDNLSFPLICPDWNAGEEILLLEDLSHVVGKKRVELQAMGGNTMNSKNLLKKFHSKKRPRLRKSTKRSFWLAVISAWGNTDEANIGETTENSSSDDDEPGVDALLI